MILALGGTASASVTWSETTGAGARGRSSVSSRAMVGGAHQITSDCSFHSYLQSIPSRLGPEMETNQAAAKEHWVNEAVA